MTPPALHPGEWPLLLRQLNLREQAWNQGGRVTYGRTDAVPFLPYPLPRFAQFLLEAMAALPSWACYDDEGRHIVPRFLDVGCGPGTKLLLARAMFGLAAEGIDLVPEYIAECRQAGLQAVVQDAFTFGGYDSYALILVNRPSSRQDELEKLICDRMAPGAVLIGLNWRNNPQQLANFDCVSQEWGEPVHGVWAKPGGVVHLAARDIGSPTLCCGKPPVGLPAADSLTPDADLVNCRQVQRVEGGALVHQQRIANGAGAPSAPAP